MNDNLLQMSLNQGKHFKKKFSKIKKGKPIKEGFVSLEQEEVIRPSNQGYVPVFKNMQENTNLTTNMNQTNLNDLEQAKLKYNELLQQYTAMQQKISNSSLGSINRLSSNNPYLNKTVRFNNGPWCYVTSQGVAGWIHGFDIFDCFFPFSTQEYGPDFDNVHFMSRTPQRFDRVREGKIVQCNLQFWQQLNNSLSQCKEGLSVH